MKNPVRLLRATADRMLDALVPGTAAHAIECDTLYRCYNGRRQSRKCCVYPSGIQCTNWSNTGSSC